MDTKYEIKGYPKGLIFIEALKKCELIKDFGIVFLFVLKIGRFRDYLIGN